MSIEIIGSNGSKIKLITEDKIESVIDENEITYNLYKNKYKDIINSSKTNECINSYDHLLKQLIISFSNYDESKSFNKNLKYFNKILDKIINTTHILEYINLFFIQTNILNKLTDAIHKIIKKIIKNKLTTNSTKINFIQLNNNYYLDLLILKQLLKEININNSDEFKIKFDKLNTNIDNLNKYIDSISIIALKKKENYNNSNNSNCINDPKKIIYILDTYIENIKFIKGNILKIDSLINIIVEDIYNFYNIL